MITVNWRC